MIWTSKYGVGNDNPLQYTCLENPMNREARQATVHGVTKSQTHLSNWTYTHTKQAHKYSVTKLNQVTKGFPSGGKAHLVKSLPVTQEIQVLSTVWEEGNLWRRKWQPTPVFLPGKSHGQRNLEACSPWVTRVRQDLVTKQQQYQDKDN